jgi:hypothetical protein
MFRDFSHDDVFGQFLPVRYMRALQNLLKRTINSAIVDPDVKHLAFIVHAIMTSSKIFILEPHGESKPSLIKLNAATVLEVPVGAPCDLAAVEKAPRDMAPKKIQLSLSAIKTKSQEEAAHAQQQAGQPDATDHPLTAEATAADGKDILRLEPVTVSKPPLKISLSIPSRKNSEEPINTANTKQRETSVGSDGPSGDQSTPARNILKEEASQAQKQSGQPDHKKKIIKLQNVFRKT